MVPQYLARPLLLWLLSGLRLQLHRLGLSLLEYPVFQLLRSGQLHLSDLQYLVRPLLPWLQLVLLYLVNLLRRLGQLHLEYLVFQLHLLVQWHH